MNGGTVQSIRIAANGVSARPRRLVTVEQAVQGRALDDATLTAAGEAAIAGAQPLQHNGYKVPLLRNLVRRALRGDEDS
jgi:xanthine dehydrogenase YagS FAD-binding subunit